MLDEAPSFNLKVVVRETGLAPDTLRAWERRYGMPRPERSAGQHRLYSQRDIETLKWLSARQKEGLSISRAVELWRKLQAEGQDPLQPVLPAAPEVTATTPAAAGEALNRLRQEWLSAGLAFDEVQADQVLSQAFALYPVETVCFEVLQPGLAAIGQGWYRGEVTIQQEHFISELAVRRLETLLAAAPPPLRPGRILVACPPEEEHVFSLLVLTLCLRRRGWEILYLGANVPANRIEETLNSTQPQLALMAAQHLPTAATLLEMSEVFQTARLPLAYGGLIFNRIPALRRRIPGYFLGEQLPQAVAQVEQWLRAVNPLRPVGETETATPAYRQALNHYQEQRGMIEARVWQELRPTNGLLPLLPRINRYFAQYLSAALTLGDLNFLNQDLGWLEELLRYHTLSSEMMPRYLRFYRLAAETCLDQRGAPLLAWLAQFAAQV